MQRVTLKRVLLIGAACATASFSYTAPAVAQDGELEEVIITGTRARARSATESPAPVDVLSGDEFANQGDTDLSSLIRNVVPSYNVNTQPISDAATIVRPANLRGLAPDHTLVLINGKRRHRASVIYWLGNGIANGAQGPDISAIPSIALKQLEVLRDGAAAQYGSDAIAGVMNFILKDDSEGGSLNVKYGSHYEGDGDLVSIEGNIGLPLSSNGFANLSFEYGEADDTDRSIQRDDAAGLIAAGNTAVANPAQIWGSPKIEDSWKFWGNFGLDLGNGAEAYAHANYVTKHVDGGFYFRNPNTRGAVFSDDGGASLLVGDLTGDMSGGCMNIPITNNIPDPTMLADVFADPNCFTFQEIFPGGFTPRFGGDVSDSALTAGVKGEWNYGSGLRYDFSGSVGRNEVDFFINNTVNASLGPATPTMFDPGAYIQFERQLNADFAYNPRENVNVAFGAEYRLEEFEVRVGQEESFDIGPLAAQGFSAASNGFPGFSNIAGGQFGRENVALYVDTEWDVNDALLLGAALRWEDFQDFGTTTNFKVAGNYRVSDNLGFRATFSTGFKAPTPGQSNAFNVSTEFDFTINDLVNNGTVPSTTAVAQLRGGAALEPEESTNFTFGTFFNLGALEVTIDYFNIEIDDRLNLSPNFALTQAEIDGLVAAGVTSAGNLQNFRFFSNSFDTETTGFDIVATYPIEWGGGLTDLTFTFNNTETDVTSPLERIAFGTSDQNALSAAQQQSAIDSAAGRVAQIETGLPETRWNLQAQHTVNNWRFLARASFYDDWFDSEDGRTYDGKTLVDVEASYDLTERQKIIIGVNNVFDEVPDENPDAAAGVGNRYSQFSPFGFNGGFWYARYNYSF
ncbi:MAG: TonB-dependent receptor [Pseudomonadota bacterium]